MLLRLALGAAAALAVAVLGAFAWVRLAPDDPARWHVDPLTAQRPETPNAYLLAPADADPAARADGAAPVWETTPARLMQAFDALAMARPRTERLAGDPAGGHVTYIQRSRLWGFPDYISVRALPAEGGATLAVFSRARYGSSDLGVNRDRVSAWLDALDP